MSRYKRILLGLLKFFIIAISLLGLSIVSALITMKLVSRADLVKIPSIVGKDTVYALEQLNKIGFRLKITGQEFSDTIPENHIISQDPKPFELTRRDKAVNVVLSKGSERVDVPKIVDEPWLRAQSIIQKAGLKTGRLARTYHDEIGKNKVIAQNPQGNSMIPRGSTVDFLLSDGKSAKYYLMPSLKGLSLNSVLKMLSERELLPGEITYQYNITFAPNTILSQGIKSGFRVQSGEKIDLIVSKAEKPDQEEAGIYTTLNYRIPQGLEKKEVRILLEDGGNIRDIFHKICSPGEEIELLLRTTRNTKAKIYLDNELVEERRF